MIFLTLYSKSFRHFHPLARRPPPTVFRWYKTFGLTSHPWRSSNSTTTISRLKRVIEKLHRLARIDWRLARASSFPPCDCFFSHLTYWGNLVLCRFGLISESKQLERLEQSDDQKTTIAESFVCLPTLVFEKSTTEIEEKSPGVKKQKSTNRSQSKKKISP